MAPREMIVSMTKNRMDKLNQFGGGPIPIRVKGAGKSGEFTAVMIPKHSGGMLSAAGMRGGMLSAAGTQRGGTNWLNVAKKASAVASPHAMLAGPEMLPVSAGLAAFAGSGKKKKAGVSKKQGKKIKIRALTWRRRLVQSPPSRRATTRKRTPCNVSARSLQIGVAVRRRRR